MKNSYQPKNEFEELFDVKPIGVKYRCEYCGEGEQIYQSTRETVESLLQTDMYQHKCDKCGMVLMLPKVYPYIEWIKV